MAFALKYFFTHHRIEKVQDLQKAVHKKEEHDRKEQRVAPRREERAEARPEGRPEGRERSGRGGRERSGRGGERGDRGERGERRPRREREPAPAAEGVPTLAVVPAEVAEAPSSRPSASGPVEIPVTREPVEIPVTREDAESSPRARPTASRVFVTAGEADGADEAKARELIATLAPGVEVVRVEVRRTHMFLEVKPEDVESIVGALNGKEGFGKALAAEKARRRRR
jgi:ATP-dependent RNA helicase DeaD